MIPGPKSCLLVKIFPVICFKIIYLFQNFTYSSAVRNSKRASPKKPKNCKWLYHINNISVVDDRLFPQKWDSFAH